MELSLYRSLSLAFFVGAWSLAVQFIFNRIIFFYIANSDYAAASIISIHLAGFWLGSVWARRRDLSISMLISLGFLSTVWAYFFTWWLGAATLGLPLTVLAAVCCGLAMAVTSGALVVTLMRGCVEERRVLIADSAGSIVGAVIGGFILVPSFGLAVAFSTVAAVQGVALASVLRGVSALMVCVLTLGFVTLVAFLSPVRSTMLVSSGLPLIKAGLDEHIILSEQSPFGVVSVAADGSFRSLYVDNRNLCGVGEGDINLHSQFKLGRVPMRMIEGLPTQTPRIANIGLGCGATLAGILEGSSDKALIDAIEINAEVVAAQKEFWPLLPHNPSDQRVSMHVTDGFAFFAKAPQGDKYAVVVIDLVWLHNHSATHLFSAEMYENVKKHMNEDGVLAVWTIFTNPFSAPTEIIYRTLREVFPNVVADSSSGFTMFFASPKRADLRNFIDIESQHVSSWLEDSARNAPVNRMDDLVLNRHKFTWFGDSTWDRLFEKYQ